MTDVAALQQRSGELRRAVDRRTGEALRLAREGLACEQKIIELQESLEVHQKAQALLTTISEAQQAAAQSQVEELVTRALQVVFGEELSFHLVPSVKANRTEIDFIIRSTYGGEVIDTNVMDARGGGMAAVVGFVLRLVILLLTPGARRLLVLDETFAHVSASFEQRVAELIREVVDKAGVQVLLVTHSTAYGDLADQKYRVSLGPGGITQIEEGVSE